MGGDNFDDNLTYYILGASKHIFSVYPTGIL